MTESQSVMTLAEVVRAFLEIALVEPEKPPKTQRAQRDNRMLVLGFNRAQETLRTVLEHHGSSDEVRALAEVRADGQEQPMQTGFGKVWVA